MSALATAHHSNSASYRRLIRLLRDLSAKLCANWNAVRVCCCVAHCRRVLLQQAELHKLCLQTLQSAIRKPIPVPGASSDALSFHKNWFSIPLRSACFFSYYVVPPYKPWFPWTRPGVATYGASPAADMPLVSCTVLMVNCVGGKLNLLVVICAFSGV